jgi:hypothetical protein
VQGFPWCLTEPKKVGLASAVKRHLCDKHNSMLSETDMAAKAVSEAIGQAAISVDGGAPPAVFNVNGRSFERWALKTLINICTEDGHRIGRDSNSPNAPAPSLVRLAFGLRHFPW